MPDNYDPIRDLAEMVAAGIAYRSDFPLYAGRIAERLGLGEDDAVEAVAAELRRALGLKACGDPVGTVTDLWSQSPRTVTRDGRHLVIPALRLDAEGCALLRTIINNEAADLEASS